jgi:predicted RNase H-like HicB family nuclease
MTMPTKHTINLEWDPEARVWVVTSQTFRGLVAEGTTIDSALKRACMIISTDITPQLRGDS